MSKHEELSRSRTKPTSVRAEPALFSAARDAYAWEVATDRTRAHSSAEWIEQAVAKLARMSAPARAKVVARFPPARYVAGSTKRPHAVRLSPALLAQLDEARAVDGEGALSRNDLIVTALRAAVARSERAAGGKLPPAPDRLPQRAVRPPLGKERVSVTVSAPASFHAALVDLHAASESTSSYVAWIGETLGAWADLSDAQRAEARARFTMPAAKNRDDETVRRSYRIPSSVRDRLRPIENAHPRTIVEALAWQLDVGLTLL